MGGLMARCTERKSLTSLPDPAANKSANFAKQMFLGRHCSVQWRTSHFTATRLRVGIFMLASFAPLVIYRNKIHASNRNFK